MTSKIKIIVIYRPQEISPGPTQIGRNEVAEEFVYLQLRKRNKSNRYGQNRSRQTVMDLKKPWDM